MADVVDQSVLDTVNIASTNGIAQAGAFAFGNRFNDDVSGAKISSSIAEAHLGKLLKNITSTDPVEGVANAKLFKGEGDSMIASVLAQLGAGQVGGKIAMSTPSESGNAHLLAQLVAIVAAGQVMGKGAQTT